MNSCECGCGQPTKRKFARGHHVRIKHHQTGKSHSPERLALMTGRGKALHPEGVIKYPNLRGAARGAGLELQFTREEYWAWLEGRELACEYCGITPASLRLVRGNYGRKYLGIDRINPAMGYVLSNCTLCCGVCNHVKGSEFSRDEMRILGESIARVFSTRDSMFTDLTTAGKVGTVPS